MKKTLLWTAGTLLGFFALNTMAAEAVLVKPIVQPAISCCSCIPTCGFYVDGYIGDSNQTWKYSGLINNVSDPATKLSHSLSNDPNGFTGGFDAGYKINPNIAGEFGAYFLPTVDAKWTLSTGATKTHGTATITSWFPYGALKFMAPIRTNTDIFIKVGGATRITQFRNDPAGIGQPGTPNMDVNSFNLLFGAGLQYFCNKALSFNFQWLYLRGNSVTVPASATPPASIPGSISVPTLNMFLVGIGINLNNLAFN